MKHVFERFCKARRLPAESAGRCIASLLCPILLLITLSSCTSYVVIDENGRRDIYTAVPHIKIKDTGEIRFSRGAQVVEAKAYHNAIAHIDAQSELIHFHGFDSAALETTGGSITFINLHDRATVAVRGGTIAWIRLFDESTAHLKHSDQLTWLVVADDAKVHIYADTLADSGILLTGTLDNGRPFHCRRLSGTWGNDQAFWFWMLVDGKQAEEPLSSLLLHHPTAN